MPNFRQRKWFWIVMAIAVVILLTLVAAPNSGGRKNDSGSTYGRNPDGYGAWYEYMSKQEIPLKRWRKPFSEFIKDDIQDATYLKILSQNEYLLDSILLLPEEMDWVKQGNTFVVIGQYAPTTAAPFNSSISYRREALVNDQIKIATTRRFLRSNNQESILQDSYGAVIWQEKIGKGKVIYCTTPYLAANAYQNNLDNYQLLAELVNDHSEIWVDEYIHGYKDKETIAEESAGNVLGYLIETPWFFLLVQTILIAIVAALDGLRRFGLPLKPKMTIADNSNAYIDALAGVLEKANSTEFVVEAIAKDEQHKLQQSLGLSKSLVDEPTLIKAYQQQHGEQVTDLRQLLRVSNSKQKISNAHLISWIQQWQKLNRDS